ncbi:MAG: DUF4350 domain-containing protein [Kiloniellaceae bacterium]
MSGGPSGGANGSPNGYPGGTGGVFSGRAVGLLVAVGLLSFAAAALVGIYADPQTDGAYGGNAYSYSAIGHKAWTEVLGDLGIPVVVSRHDSASRAYYDDGVLVLAQPHHDADGLLALEQAWETDRVLVVLPKWTGWPGYENRRWIKTLRPLDATAVTRALEVIDEDARLVRRDGTETWRSQDWDILPSLENPQLIVSETITPIVYSEAGVLLGEYRTSDTTLWLLADPDVISNSGIDEGDNAAFAVAMVSALLPPGSAVVFDETIHGFTVSPDLWKALLSFPLNLAVLQSLLAVAVLVWATVGRFGAPLPPRPRLQAGKQVLIANTASLFEYAGDVSNILHRYRDTCLRDLARHLHIPPDIPLRHDERALVHWLNQVGDARGTSQRYSEVNRAVTAAIDDSARAVTRTLRAAAQLYRWKQEMIHGHRADPDSLRPGQGAGAQDGRRTGRRT